MSNTVVDVKSTSDGTLAKHKGLGALTKIVARKKGNAKEIFDERI